MTTNVSSSCSGQDKEKADRYAIDVFNYSYKIGFYGIAPDPTELSRIEQGYAQLTPACQQYIQLIGERLQQMLQAGQIRDQIDKLPW